MSNRYLSLLPPDLRSREWEVEGEWAVVTSDTLTIMLSNLHEGREPNAMLGDRSGKRFGKVSQLLRRAGVVEYNRSTQQWKFTETGLQGG